MKIKILIFIFLVAMNRNSRQRIFHHILDQQQQQKKKLSSDMKATRLIYPSDFYWHIVCNRG